MSDAKDMKDTWVWVKIVGGIAASLAFWAVFLFGLPGHHSGGQHQVCDQQLGCHIVKD